MCKAVLILSFDISLSNCDQRKPEVAHCPPPKWKKKTSCICTTMCKHVWSGGPAWLSIPKSSCPLTLTSHGIMVQGETCYEQQQTWIPQKKQKKTTIVTSWWFRPTWFQVANLTKDETIATKKTQPSHRSPECHLDAPSFSRGVQVTQEVSPAL